MRQIVKKWYTSNENYNRVVLASRVWMVRNCADYDFPSKITPEDAEQLVSRIRDMKRDISLRQGKVFYSCNFTDLSDADKNELLAQRVITAPFAAKTIETGLILSDDEAESIMVNDFDHIRIHVDRPGLALQQCYEAAAEIEDIISEKVNMAYDPTFGFLSSDPLSGGTGVIGEIIVMLPAILAARQTDAVREFLKEREAVMTDMFNMKDTVPLFCIRLRKASVFNPAEIIDELESIASMIVHFEIDARNKWIEARGNWLTDKISRSYGIVKYSREIDFREAVILLVQIRMGIDQKLVSFSGIMPSILELIYGMTDPLLIKTLGREIPPEEMGAARAEYLRSKFATINEA